MNQIARTPKDIGNVLRNVRKAKRLDTGPVGQSCGRLAAHGLEH